MRELWQHFQDNNRDINIVECGIQQFNPMESYQYIAYQNFILHYVERGRGIYKVDGKEYHLEAGDGFIISKGMSVNYVADKSKPWKNYWIGLSGDDLFNCLENTNLLQNVVLTFKKQSKSPEIIKKICDTTLSEGSNQINDVWYLSYVYRLLFYLGEEFKLSNNTFKKTIDTQNYAKIAFDYIYSNYMNSITIQGIANYIGIDRSYLYRQFKEKYDISPKQFLLHFRMDKAKKMLRKTSDNVYVIAEKVGYLDQLQFTKAFKKQFGISPTNYRKNSKLKY